MFAYVYRCVTIQTVSFFIDVMNILSQTFMTLCHIHDISRIIHQNHSGFKKKMYEEKMETELHCNKLSSVESIYILQIDPASFDFKTLQQHLLKGTWFALVGEKNAYPLL